MELAVWVVLVVESEGFSIVLWAVVFPVDFFRFGLGREVATSVVAEGEEIGEEPSSVEATGEVSIADVLVVGLSEAGAGVGSGGIFSTCPGFRLLFFKPFSFLSAFTDTPNLWAIAQQESPLATV